MGKGNKKIVISATKTLASLWEKGFFKTWQSYSQIEKRLSRDGFHFSVPELGMALKRATYLTRRGKTGKYEYIQKGPYHSADE